jgi:hypothetical protein
MRIPRSVRDLQVVRESLFCDVSSQRLFHGLDLFFGQRRSSFLYALCRQLSPFIAQWICIDLSLQGARP